MLQGDNPGVPIAPPTILFFKAGHPAPLKLKPSFFLLHSISPDRQPNFFYEKGGLAVAEPTHRGTLTALECLSLSAEDAGF